MNGMKTWIMDTGPQDWSGCVDNDVLLMIVFTQVRLSETRVDNVWMMQDYGANYDSGTATHHLTMYRSLMTPCVLCDHVTTMYF